MSSTNRDRLPAYPDLYPPIPDSSTLKVSFPIQISQDLFGGRMSGHTFISVSASTFISVSASISLPALYQAVMLEFEAEQIPHLEFLSIERLYVHWAALRPDFHSGGQELPFPPKTRIRESNVGALLDYLRVRRGYDFIEVVMREI